MKKCICFLMCFLIIVSCLIPSRVVFAFSYETNKKVDISSYDKFREATYGKAYNLDGAYGAQCWDGVQLLYSNLGMTLITGERGFVKYCWLNETSRNANTGSQFTQITDKTKIRRGDVVVWYCSSESDTGHIAFADEDYNTSGWIRLYGQNQLTPDPYNGCPFSVGVNGNENGKCSTNYILRRFIFFLL